MELIWFLWSKRLYNNASSSTIKQCSDFIHCGVFSQRHQCWTTAATSTECATLQQCLNCIMNVVSCAAISSQTTKDIIYCNTPIPALLQCYSMTLSIHLSYIHIFVYGWDNSGGNTGENTKICFCKHFLYCAPCILHASARNYHYTLLGSLRVGITTYHQQGTMASTRRLLNLTRKAAICTLTLGPVVARRFIGIPYPVLLRRRGTPRESNTSSLFFQLYCGETGRVVTSSVSFAGTQRWSPLGE